MKRDPMNDSCPVEWLDAADRADEADRAEFKRAEREADHDCWDNAVPYVSDGPLGHGWECGKCGAFLQAG